jgi:glutamate 5-kinase
MTVVVKLGSTLVATPDGRVRRGLLAARSAEIAELKASGEQVCIVSSGAIALGLPRIADPRAKHPTAVLQAASAVGQPLLQRAWASALGKHGLEPAQVLLTATDLAGRTSYLKVRSAFRALLAAGVVPVINENDTTATDEIAFGDNDLLAAQLAVLIGARCLILLTEVEGVYSDHPSHPDAQLLADGDIAAGARFGRGSGLGRGGMQSKIAAGQMAAAVGIPTVIASGRRDGVLREAVTGEARGTRFGPAENKRERAFKLWLRYAKPSTASVVVDDGAGRALRGGGSSLLAVGVLRCEGRFATGDAIDILSADGELLGKGIAGASSSELESRPYGVEAVHRDRLVLFGGEGAAETV